MMTVIAGSQKNPALFVTARGLGGLSCPVRIAIQKRTDLRDTLLDMA
jgi:hypothetical protein